MGAPEHEGVNLGRTDRGEVLTGEGQNVGPRGDSRLHERDKFGTRDADDFQAWGDRECIVIGT